MSVLESAVEEPVGLATLPRRLPPLRGVISGDAGGNAIGRNDQGKLISVVARERNPAQILLGDVLCPSSKVWIKRSREG